MSLIFWWLAISLKAGNVTFRVDMSQVSINANGPHLMGSMNGWNPGSDTLIPQGGGIYAKTWNFPPGTMVEYKFVNGNAWGDEEVVFGECEFTTYRYLVAGVADTILPVVCFGYCDSACTPPTGQRIACIGNSITWGSGTSNRWEFSPPAVVRDSLGSSALVVNFGVPGAAMLRNAGFSYWDRPHFAYVQSFAPEIALVMLGTNDSKTTLWAQYSGEFYADYDSFVDVLQALPTTPRMLLVCPPKAFSGAFGIQDSVIAGEIVPAIRALARVRCLEVLDMYTRTAGLSSQFPGGIHPNDSGSQVMAHAMLAAIQRPPLTIAQAGNVLTAPAGYAFQWYRDGDTIATSAGGQAMALTATQPGVYKVAVQPDSLRADVWLTEALTHVTLSSLPAGTPGPSWLFPVPATDFLRLHPGFQLSGKLRIRTSNGQTLLQRAHFTDQNLLDIQALPPGIYCAELITSSTVLRQKISIVR